MTTDNTANATRRSKNSTKCAEINGWLSDDPQTWSDEQHAIFNRFKKDERKAYQQAIDQERIANGQLQYIPVSQLAPEAHKMKKEANKRTQMIANEVRRALRTIAATRGLATFTHFRDATLPKLRQALSKAMTTEEVKALEKEIKRKLKHSPPTHKAPDENGYCKPGPAKNKDGVTDPEKLRKRAMGCESSNRTEAKHRALYNEASKYEAMPPLSHFQNNTSICNILRKYISDEDIERIKEEAVREYNESIQDKKVSRKESRSASLLDQFFDTYPDITRASKVALLSDEDHKKYKDFLDEKDPERVERRREHFRQYDAAHREERKEAQKKRRIDNPEAARAIEAAYRSTDNGKLVTLFKDTRRWAESKGLPFDITKELIAALSQEPCYYCGDDLDDYGVDAVDINAGFVDGNVRPCCRVCNKAKKDHHYREFLRMMCNIGMVHSSDMDAAWVLDHTFTDTSKVKGSVSFTHYKANAKARSIPFHLTQSEFTELTAQPCWYCRVERNGKPVGLDKVDPKGPYSLDNVVPSCATCNVLKWDTPQNVFLDKACKILNKWANNI